MAITSAKPVGWDCQSLLNVSTVASSFRAIVHKASTGVQPLQGASSSRLGGHGGELVVNQSSRTALQQASCTYATPCSAKWPDPNASRLGFIAPTWTLNSSQRRTHQPLVVRRCVDVNGCSSELILIDGLADCQFIRLLFDLVINGFVVWTRSIFDIGGLSFHIVSFSRFKRCVCSASWWSRIVNYVGTGTIIRW